MLFCIQKRQSNKNKEKEKDKDKDKEKEENQEKVQDKKVPSTSKKVDDEKDKDMDEIQRKLDILPSPNSPSIEPVETEQETEPIATSSPPPLPPPKSPKSSKKTLDLAKLQNDIIPVTHEFVRNAFGMVPLSNYGENMHFQLKEITSYNPHQCNVMMNELCHIHIFTF